MDSHRNIGAKGPTEPGLANARRLLHETQKTHFLKSGAFSTSRPLSTLEQTLQALQWRKEFTPTKDTGIVRRGLWKFERDLEEERIRLAEDLVRRADPGPHEDPSYLALLAYQAASIEMAIRHVSNRDDQQWSKFLLGTVASADVNAFAMTHLTADYAVVGVHSALIDFIYQAAKAVVAAGHPVRSYDGKADVQASVSRESIRLQLTRDPEPANRLYRTLEAYFFKGYPRAFSHEEVKEENHPPLDALISMSERFVIAHEYGHELVGNVSWQAVAAGANPSWVEEFSADWNAMFATVLSGHVLDHFNPEVSLSGGVFSLACLSILSQGVSILREGRIVADEGTDSHPPLRMRAEQIVEGFHKFFHVEYFDGFRGCKLWLVTEPKKTTEADSAVFEHVHSGAFAWANALFVIWDVVREMLVQDYASRRPLHSIWATGVP